MNLDLTPEELLTTTRAVRKRLDLERPVERAVIEDCVRIAQQAPSGSNRQILHFVIIDDAATKTALAAMYARAFDPLHGTPPVDYPSGDSREERLPAVLDSALYLRQHMHEVPALVVPVAEGRIDAGDDLAWHAGRWGSVLPGVWSFMLAARLKGLGTALTTVHLAYEEEAADLLGLPYAETTQLGLLPIAYTLGTSFKPASRIDTDRVVHWNAW
ncbi:MAG: nitroreductase [Acidimicrobiales bacterium]|nr:nitroreductase [Acidimicrobiales bacterium]